MKIIKIKMENIKSKLIVKRIFENLKTRKKLNIVKHSKKYLDILNIDKKDFASIVSLKNLDKKFHLDLDIADTNIKVLDLSKAKLITGEIKDYFGFKNINNLVNVTIIEAITLDKLEVLDLGDNYIRELNVLEKFNLKNLAKLYLYNNYISDISALKKCKFENLNILNLSQNKIKDINVLEHVNFKKLEILNLRDNKISDVDVLKKVNFKELKELYLNKNNISKIDFLNKNIFPKLEILNLKKNKINLIENKNENAPAISYLKISLKKFSYKHNRK